jgi:hypothetical protein
MPVPVVGLVTDGAAAWPTPANCELTCAGFTLACSGKYNSYACNLKGAYSACRQNGSCLSIMYEWDAYSSYYFSSTKDQCLDRIATGLYGYQSKLGHDRSLCPFIPDLYPACHS